MSDKPYRLAYELALRAIDDQAKVVDNIRARAGTIFAATALVTSFLGGQALARVRREHPAADLVLLSWTSLAIASFVAGAALSLAVLLPYRLRFSVSARAIRGRLMWYFRAAILFLAVEVAAWIVVIWRATP